MSTIILIDISNLVHREFAIRQHDGDTDATAREVVAKVRSLAHGQAHVAICCDSGRSFRKDISAEYKAQRGERDPSLYHQMRVVCDRLREDGFPVWAVKEMEADDIIATATAKALAMVDADGVPAHDVLIVSSDKDLCALVGPFVQMKRPDTNAIVDEAGVVEKFGVQPCQMRDYLALVGDASDNVKGAHKVGPKTASALLQKFGSLDDLYADIDGADALKLKALGITPALAESLKEFAARKDHVRQLVTLREDVEIPFDELFVTRVPKAVADYNPEADYPAADGEETMPEQEQQQGQPEAAGEAQVVTGTIEPAEAPASPTEAEKRAPATVTAMVPRTGEILPPWDQRLLPRDQRETRILSKEIFESNLFAAYGSPQAVTAIIVAGAEMGMTPMASLRGWHIIDGKPSMSAATMAAVVMNSGKAEYFEPIEIGPESVTFETKRKGARNPIRITHTIEMARKAWSKGDDAWNKSGWGRNPTDMLVARCQSRLARYGYPDILNNVYTPEELREARDSEAQAS